MEWPKEFEMRPCYFDPTQQMKVRTMSSTIDDMGDWDATRRRRDLNKDAIKITAAPQEATHEMNVLQLRKRALDMDTLKHNPLAIQVGSIWRHFRGNLYKVVGFAIRTETAELLVLYTAIKHPLVFPWSRPLNAWQSSVEKEDGSRVARFSLHRPTLPLLPKEGEDDPPTLGKKANDDCAKLTELFRQIYELMNNPGPFAIGTIWKHFTGDLYRITNFAIREDTLDILVLYDSVVRALAFPWSGALDNWCPAVGPQCDPEMCRFSPCVDVDFALLNDGDRNRQQQR